MHPELMWAAGFYEGEGSISGSDRTLQIIVSQVDREPLDHFFSVFNAGTIRFSPIRRIHLYQASGLTAQRIAMQMYPALSARRQGQILRAISRYIFRRVRDPQRCRQGHRYSEVGVYSDPGGGRECVACRARRHHGPLPAAVLPTAFEARVGIREYVPPPFGEPEKAYDPVVQT